MELLVGQRLRVDLGESNIMMRKVCGVALAAVTAISLAGCNTPAGQGAAGGAVIGGATGALLGAAVTNRPGGALLGGLDAIPQSLAIEYPGGRAVGGENFGVVDTLLMSVIVGETVALVGERLGGAIGGGRYYALAFGAADNLRGEMINRHP